MTEAEGNADLQPAFNAPTLQAGVAELTPRNWKKARDQSLKQAA